MGGGDVLGLVLLALVPGLLALGLYYVGLQATPAARATPDELAVPVIAAILGIAERRAGVVRSR